MDIADNPDYWRAHAKAAQLIADEMSEGVARHIMLDIVKCYMRLAENAERLRLLSQPPPTPTAS